MLLRAYKLPKFWQRTMEQRLDAKELNNKIFVKI